MEDPFSFFFVIIFLTTVTFTTSFSPSKYIQLKPPSIEDLTILSPDQYEIEQESEQQTAEKYFLAKDNIHLQDKSTELYKIDNEEEEIDKYQEETNKDYDEDRIEDRYDSLKKNNKKGDNVELKGIDDELKQKLKSRYRIEHQSDHSQLDDSDKLNKIKNYNFKKNSKHYLNNLQDSLELYKPLRTDKRVPTTSIVDNSKSNEFTFFKHKSPEELGLQSSLDFPLPDLIETKNQIYDPNELDLNTTHLKSKLGELFDPNFMSIVKPKINLSKNKFLQMNNFTRNKNGRLMIADNLPDYLKEINFKYIYLSENDRLATRISFKLKKKMQQFLQMFTKCLVTYKWKDLGLRFWPRYLKQGYCVNTTSCSIPPGMTCKPKDIQYKTLLRYHCNRNKCSWRNVQYPILTSCQCACP